ncbi:MAG: Rieske 2Fe-2S domain-containing protein [Nitrospirae bacterium]|nr:Rieske 2Fe-2S domain-containing protein [Nitrospirota bacterium]
MKVNISAVGQGGMVEVLDGSTPVLIANVGGNFYAVGGVCPHMRCRLAKGTLSGGTVTCPCHGASFDVKTGKILSWVTSMSKDLVKVSQLFGWAKDLKTYKVQVEGDFLELS